MGSWATIIIGGKSMTNTWDYKKGDLIKVEKLGWPVECGVITRCAGSLAAEKPAFPRKYWEWVGTSGRTQFFFEVKSPLQEDFKIKVLARA
jgi:hypothetical protein